MPVEQVHDGLGSTAKVAVGGRWGAGRFVPFELMVRGEPSLVLHCAPFLGAPSVEVDFD